MSAAVLLQLLSLLQTLGPIAVQAVADLKVSGNGSPNDIAKLDALIEQMDTQRMASWAAADTALS